MFVSHISKQPFLKSQPPNPRMFENDRGVIDFKSLLFSIFFLNYQYLSIALYGITKKERISDVISQKVLVNISNPCSLFSVPISQLLSNKNAIFQTSVKLMISREWFLKYQSKSIPIAHLQKSPPPLMFSFLSSPGLQ